MMVRLKTCVEEKEYGAINKAINKIQHLMKLSKERCSKIQNKRFEQKVSLDTNRAKEQTERETMNNNANNAHTKLRKIKTDGSNKEKELNVIDKDRKSTKKKIKTVKAEIEK
eukprot:UN03364